MATDQTFFVAKSTTGSGMGLWVTDGTASGTRQIQAVGASSLGLNPNNLAVSASGTLFFDGFDSAIKSNLWVSDGTNAGTHELQVPSAPASGLSPDSIAAFGNGIAFTSLSSPGLWLSDGTAAGTMELNVPGAPSGSFYIGNLVSFGGKLYFDGEVNSVTNLWVSDGTAAGTHALQVPGTSPLGLSPGSLPNSIVSIGTKLVFNAEDASGNRGLWVSDGTAAGTVELQIPGLNPAHGFTGEPNGFLAFGNKAAFVAADASGQNGIWVTDGTAAGTVELPGVHASSSVETPMAAISGGKLAFIAADSSGASGVWVTDGTAAGTQELQPPGGGANLSPDGLVAINGRVLFDGLDASDAERLWTSDGTNAGTSVLPVSSPVVLESGYTTISAETSPPASTPPTSPTGTGPVGTTPPTTSTPSPGTPAATPNFAWTDTTTGTASTGNGDAYSGPVTTLTRQLIWPSTDSVNIHANIANVFMHGGPGTDALQATAGSNVLDGGTGSNFLVGATGADGGTDTFFIDARANSPTWSTLTNFHSGDAVTLWGFQGGTSAMTWAASDGTAGYQGATIHAETNGARTGVNGSVTFAGVNLADARSKFAMSTGSVGGNSYLYLKYTG